MIYEAEFSIELPPAGLQRSGRVEWNPRKDFREEVENEIRQHAFIQSEKIEGNVATYLVHWEVGIKDSSIEDTYDLAVSVQELETELLSMRYTGYLEIPKPKEVS